MIYEGNYISDYISYSLLKRFDEEGPKGLIAPKKIDNSGIRYGTLLDDYIFLDKDKFYDKYKIVSNNLPPALEKLARKVAKTFKLEVIDNISNDIKLKRKVVYLMKKENLYKNIKKEQTFIDKFNFAEFYEYCKELYDNKNLISVKDLINVKEGKSQLFHHPKIKDLFDNDLENIYQMEIKFDYLGAKIKCYLDMVIIDHKNKTIKGIDLKTGSPPADEFMSSFFKYKYYLQAGIYDLALKRLNAEKFDGKYTVEDFKFLYLCKFDIENPIIYSVSDKWINASIKGFKTSSGFYYRGINELIREVEWHKQKKIFNVSRNVYLNDEVKLDDKFIEIYEG